MAEFIEMERFCLDDDKFDIEVKDTSFLQNDVNENYYGYQPATSDTVQQMNAIVKNAVDNTYGRIEKAYETKVTCRFDDIFEFDKLDKLRLVPGDYGEFYKEAIYFSDKNNTGLLKISTLKRK